MKRNMKLFSVLMAIVFVSSFAVSVTAAGAKHETLSGRITSQGQFMSNDGRSFALRGDKADEMSKYEGRTVEIKGTVMDDGGKKTIDVHSYRLMEGKSQSEPYSPGRSQTEGKSMK